MYTDYVVTPRRVVFQRAIATSRVPGVAQPIVVKRWGGRMIVDSVQVVMTKRDLPPFEPGAELILVLSSAKDGSYQIAGEIAGVLRVTDRSAPTHGSALKSEQLNGITVDQFEAEVRRLRP